MDPLNCGGTLSLVLLANRLLLSSVDMVVEDEEVEKMVDMDTMPHATASMPEEN